jgi:hypothetical protein
MAKGRHNGNGHGHVTETPDVSHIKNVDVTHEASDVSVGSILKFVLGLTIFAVVVFVLMFGLFRFFNAQEGQNEPKPGPMAMTQDERLPPEPRLQAAPGFGVKLENGQWVPLANREPEAEYKVLREQWDQQLNCEHPKPAGHAEPTSHEGGEKPSAEPAPDVPCTPIEKAIDMVIEKKLPARDAAAAGQDLDLPTAASSGRVTGRVKK